MGALRWVGLESTPSELVDLHSFQVAYTPCGLAMKFALRLAFLLSPVTAEFSIRVVKQKNAQAMSFQSVLRRQS